MECLSGLCNGAPRKRRDCLDGVLRRAEMRVGRLAAVGRYHRLPRHLSDDYTVGRKVLGVGRHGAVLQAKCRRTGAFVAVKSLSLRGYSAEQLSQLAAETEVFTSVDHPSVARLLAVYESEDCLHIVMERLTGGELLHRLRQRQRFSEQDAANAVWQMLVVVNYLHSHGVVHRDLKLENFLFESEDSEHLKLIDFGTSRLRHREARMSELVGTLAYTAPEVLAGNYTSRCDLWSLGVITFALLTGQMPFDGLDEVVIDRIKAGSYIDTPGLWCGISASARQFVESLLTVDPSARPTAEQALQHPWLAGRQRAQPCGCIDAGIAMALRSFANEPRLRRALLQVMAWCLTSEEHASVREAFIEMDTRRRGSLGPDDLAAALGEKLRAAGSGGARQILEACVASHLGEVDHSQQDQCCRDAWHQEISYSAFLAAALPVRIGVREDLFGATFRALDKADRGYVSVQDLERVLGEPLATQELDDLRRSCGGTVKGDAFSPEHIAQYLKEVCYALPECIGV